MWDEGPVREFARLNLGLIDRRTALRLGATDHHIQACLGRSTWEEVHPGVYYLNVTPRTWLSDVAAAVAAAGEIAAASHRTAGRIWSLDGVQTRMIELTVTFNGNPVPAGSLVHRTRRHLPRTRHEGIWVTTVERTLLDLAAFLPDRVLEKAMESALRARRTSLDLLDETIRLYGGRGVRGTKRFRRVVGLVDRDLTGSPAEVETLDLIRDAPVPMPVAQFRITLPSGDSAYPDFCWPDRMRIVEVDGFDSHSTPEQLEHDLRRQNMLLDLGWQIRRFTGREVRVDPQRVLAEITRFVLE